MHKYLFCSGYSLSLMILCLSLVLFQTPGSTAIRSSKSIWSVNWFWRDNVKIRPIPPGVDPEEFVQSQKKSKATWTSYKYWCSIFLPDYFQDEDENSSPGEGGDENGDSGEKNPWPISVEYGVPVPFYPDYAVRMVPKTPRFGIKSVRF